MASPFDSLTLAEIQQRLTQRQPAAALDPTRGSEQQLRTLATDGAAANAAFYCGDHWQSGDGWVGPRPAGSDPESAGVMADIQRAFVSKNAIKEIVNRHVAGVIGREPAWSMTPRRAMEDKEDPKRAEKKLIKEADAALTEWWDDRKILKLLQQLATCLLLHGHAAIRVFVPPGLLIDGRVPQADLAGALQHIYLSVPTAGQAAVITDDATQQQASVYVYQDGQTTRAEVSYVDLSSGKTVLRVLGSESEQRIELPLGGQLLLIDVTRDALISEQIRQLQKQLNLAKTMEGRNVVQGGFLERIVLNGQMPGTWVDDPDGQLRPNGKIQKFTPSPMRIGAGRTNFISGQPIYDEAGQVAGYTSPSVVYRDPVQPVTFEMTADAAHRAILEEAQQLHALIAGDATASGESRKQARADFASSLLPTKGELDSLIRWLLETVLALASVFAGQPEHYVELRAQCDCRIDTGPLSSEERGQIMAEVEAGLLSEETAMSMLGVEDVAAEKARIAAERTARQATAQATGLPTLPKQPPTGQDPKQPPTDPNQPPAQGAANPPQGGTP